MPRHSRRTVQEQEPTTLSDRDREIFLSLMDDPPAPNDALRRAAARHRELIDEAREPPALG